MASTVPSHAAFPTRSRALSPATGLRAALVLGCLAATGIAAWAGHPQAFIDADPELAFLLRGMAVIKAGLVLAGAAVLAWRFGRPLSPGLAATYLAGSALAAGASMLIWQLTLIPLAAGVFHLGEFALLVAAWKDVRGPAWRREA